MSTFQPAIKDIIRHEGDTSDLVVIVPDIIDMTGASVKFEIKDNSGRTIIAKSTSDQTIQVTGQEIYIAFLSSNTKRKDGKFRYEIEVTTQTAIITILKGSFIITAELIN